VEILMFIMQREVIIALAIGGAILAMIGNFLDVKELLIERKSAQVIRKSGYAVSWLSVAFFIAVGFLQ
jgi:hypothetical protein